MNSYDQFHDSFLPAPEPRKKIPAMLNTLTILSLVTAVYSIVNGIVSYYTICTQNFKDMAELGARGPMGGMMKPLLQSAEVQCRLRLPIILVLVTANLLCIAGVILMRRLNRKGYFLYVAGEVASPLFQLCLGALSSYMLATLVIPPLFLILYATQLKYMKRDT